MEGTSGGGELRQQRRGRAPGARHRGCAAVPCFSAPESLPLTQEHTQIETKSKLTRVPSSLHKPPYLQATIPWPPPTIAAVTGAERGEQGKEQACFLRVAVLPSR
nr:unnamed protein product [Digitaria exilis]